MVLTAQEVKDVMDAQMAYIDRMYYTGQYGGQTCGMLASTAGFPIWIKASGTRHGVWVGDSAGLWRLAGGQWQERDNGMSATAKTTVRYIAPCPHDQNIILCTTDDGVWRTTDGGANWSQITMPDGLNYRGIGWDTETPGLVIIAGPCLGVQRAYNPRIARSTDYGVSFTGISLPGTDGTLFNSYYEKWPGRVALHAGKCIVSCDSGWLYVMHDLWRSTDGGQTWAFTGWDENNHIWSSYEGVAPYYGVPGKFRVVGDCYNNPDTMVTEDTGSTWSFGWQGPATTGDGQPYHPLIAQAYGDQMVFDRPHNRLWLASGLGVYLSTDFGGSWTRLANISDNASIRGIAVDQATGNVFVSRYTESAEARGTYVSSDAGQNWTRIGSYYGHAMCSLGSAYDPAALGETVRGLGQYDGVSKESHTVVSGQSGAPAWLGAAVDAENYSQFDFGFDAVGGLTYRDFCGRATRTYDPNTGNIEYKIENIATLPSTDKAVEVYIGGTRVIEDVASLPSTWSFTITLPASQALRSLDYPARHCFDLGRVVYAGRGDTAKAELFRNSELTSGFTKALYHIYYGGMTQGYGDNYQWDDPNPYMPVCYKDAWMVMNGDLTDTVPQGLGSDGGYYYPHESKTRARLFGLPVLPSFLTLLRGTGYTRMMWAIKLLQKSVDLDRKYKDPAFGMLPWVWDPMVPGSEYVTIREIADGACDRWDAMDGLGYPNASSDNPYLERISGGRASGFTTPQFVIFMTLLGYGLGYQKYKDYADAAVVQLRQFTWGCGPYDDPGYGIVQGVEYYRPEHTGGSIPVFSQYTVNGEVRLGHAGKAFADKLVDDIAFFDPHLPIPLPEELKRGLETWDNLRQQANDANVIPTTMEGTTLCFIALRIYLRYKYNQVYPADTGANGLAVLGGGLIRGRVCVAGTQPLIPYVGVQVVMIEGNVTGHPSNLNNYLHTIAVTDADGRFAMPLMSAGTKTMYFWKPGSTYYSGFARTTFSVASPTSILQFPGDILLTAYEA